MREVAVLGIGQTPADEHWDKSLRELAGEAVLSAMQDAGLESAEGLFVGNMMSGAANHQQHLGAYIADWVGLRHASALHIEAACGSGSAAFRTAFMAVASGAMDTAVAVGVEKMTDSPGAEITAQLATAADADWELDYGPVVCGAECADHAALYARIRLEARTFCPVLDQCARQRDP